ncbi:MAG: hypothetical protein IPP04_17120 [Saprospiraceae bacterium]|nr:hypothetical protein [Saprospiraceae bacterium]
MTVSTLHSLVINGTFFSFVTNQNLNTAIGHGKQLAFGPHNHQRKWQGSLLLSSTKKWIGDQSTCKADVACCLQILPGANPMHSNRHTLS